MDELAELERRINHKIAQTKDKMHKTQERAVTDRLWPEIEIGWLVVDWISDEYDFFEEQERYSRPNYEANLVNNWIHGLEVRKDLLYVINRTYVSYSIMQRHPKMYPAISKLHQGGSHYIEIIAVVC